MLDMLAPEYFVAVAVENLTPFFKSSFTIIANKQNDWDLRQRTLDNLKYAHEHGGPLCRAACVETVDLLRAVGAVGDGV